MTKMPDLNVELREIPNLSFAELKDLYIILYNQEPPKATTRKEFFIWRVTHRLQELRFGGLDSKTKSLLENMDKSIIPEKPLPLGTEIIRKFKGETYRLRVVVGGFEMDNEFYKSLSAVAYKITGRKISGKEFWGV